ncbi:MAG: SIMPL domain-containing protein [Patescibacteria group bacterium]
MNDLHADKKRNLQYLSVVLVVLALFLGVKTLAGWQDYWGSSIEPKGPTITVEGKGEVFATPDIAQFTFGVETKAKTVADAQKEAREVANAALDYLKKSGIADKDIKTADYSFYPEYSYEQIKSSVCTEYSCPPSGKQVLVGYRVNQQFSVKVRTPDKAGEIVDGLGALKVTNVSGVNFTQDNDEELKRKARELAIADAREKAQALARDLGVRIVRVVSFSESGFYPSYAKLEYAADGRGGSAVAQVAPTELPQGENKISSNVNITYEIR